MNLLAMCQSPQTDPAILEGLADDRHLPSMCVETLVSNPSTPLPSLLRLGAKLPGRLLDNPVWSLMMLADPGFLDSLPRNTAIGLAGHPGVPHDLLYALAGAKGRHPDVRAAAASNPTAPEALLTTYFTHHQAVRCGLARNPVLRADWLRRLAEDRSHSVRAEIGRRMDAPADILSTLAHDGRSDFVRVAVAGNPMTPNSALEHLAELDHPSILAALRRRRHLSPRLREFVEAELKRSKW